MWKEVFTPSFILTFKTFWKEHSKTEDLLCSVHLIETQFSAPTDISVILCHSTINGCPEAHRIKTDGAF